MKITIQSWENIKPSHHEYGAWRKLANAHAFGVKWQDGELYILQVLGGKHVATN